MPTGHIGLGPEPAPAKAGVSSMNTRRLGSSRPCGLRLLGSCYEELGETGSPLRASCGLPRPIWPRAWKKPGRSLTQLTASTTRSRAPYRRTLAIARAAARQRRAGPVTGWGPTGRRCRRLFPASMRLGAPAGHPVVGTARGGEPCSAATRSGPIRRCPRLPPAGLRPLYRGFRHRRSNHSETASGRAMSVVAETHQLASVICRSAASQNVSYGSN
jgi:hypothetical protein